MGELWLFIGKMMIIEGMLSELKLFPMITQSFLNDFPSFTKTPQVTLHRKLRRQKRRRRMRIIMTDGVRIPSRKKREGGDNFPEGVPGDGYFNDVRNLKIAQ